MGKESKERVKARQSHHSALWIPAYAGMTVRDARKDGPGFTRLVLFL